MILIVSITTFLIVIRSPCEQGVVVLLILNQLHTVLLPSFETALLFTPELYSTRSNYFYLSWQKDKQIEVLFPNVHQK